MDQTLIELDASQQAAAVDRDGFDIGWDHAHHGLVPPPELLLDGTPVSQGWLAGKAVYGARTLSCTRHTRLWLQLRVQAWRLGIPFEGQQLTPNYLAQIQAARCPVTRELLQGARGQPDTLVVARLNADAGYAAGNVAVMSLAAARAGVGLSVQDCVRQAHRAAVLSAGTHSAGIAAAAVTPQPASNVAAQTLSASAPNPAPHSHGDNLSAAAWWRLAALRSYATPLPFAVVAVLPLAVLPPNRVRLLNAVQGLQALLTRSFLAPRWSERCRRFAQWLPEHTLRQDFNLFVGAMAPRVLEAGCDAGALRQALEDAWLNERVLRRWQHFALQLGETAAEALLARATEAGLAGIRTLHHANEQATDGWALPAARSQVHEAAPALPLRGATRDLAGETLHQRRLAATGINALLAPPAAQRSHNAQALLC